MGSWPIYGKIMAIQLQYQVGGVKVTPDGNEPLTSLYV